MTSSLVTWQDRLRAEHEVTVNRLTKLRRFIYQENGTASDEFLALPSDDRDDLLEQLMHMEGYADVMARRIARLDEQARWDTDISGADDA